MIVANTVGGVYKLCVGGFHRNCLLVSTLPNVPTFTATHTTTSKYDTYKGHQTCTTYEAYDSADSASDLNLLINLLISQKSGSPCSSRFGFLNVYSFGRGAKSPNSLVLSLVV